MDEGELFELLERYAPLICSIAVRHGLHSDEVDDVYQNVAHFVVEHRDQVRDRDSVPRWLARIARYKSLEQLRRRGRGKSLPDQVAELPDANPLPEELAIMAEQQARILDALQKLTPKQRELITALFLSGDPISYAELAARLGVSPGSLGRMRQRGLDRLRRELEDLRDTLGFDDPDEDETDEDDDDADGATDASDGGSPADPDDDPGVAPT